MPNPTEQQWAPRGNTRAQFNDNRRDPDEERTVPILGGGDDDHQQKERRRPSRDQGSTYQRTRATGWSIGTHRQISPPVLTRNSRLKPVAYLDLLNHASLGNVTAEHPPASIAKMADQLMAAIKPASPTTSTMTLIEIKERLWIKYDLSYCRRRWSTRSEHEIPHSPDWRRRRQMVSTQTMTEDEPPPPVPE
ncbi:hypothetical protein DPEC_G00134790 [Dallia pectoralis]|uniref:Uncharacterized protein n=1 Tax=Dallia pectoralis TaxID=75939 RepID=A0ACC2GSG2_DALPE|nr:hypothetical protein DPEC_G00134790 [Dallia pectoralis]